MLDNLRGRQNTFVLQIQRHRRSVCLPKIMESSERSSSPNLSEVMTSLSKDVSLFANSQVTSPGISFCLPSEPSSSAGLQTPAGIFLRDHLHLLASYRFFTSIPSFDSQPTFTQEVPSVPFGSHCSSQEPIYPAPLSKPGSHSTSQESTVS